MGEKSFKNLSRILLALILAASLLVPVFGPAEGFGSHGPAGVQTAAAAGNESEEGRSISIGSAAELKAFADKVNDGDESYSKAKVTITSDIDLGMVSWTPIGKSSVSPFYGTFEGNNHTISGINVDNARSYYGFFGCLTNAAVKDLTIKGQVYCSEPYAIVGGLAGAAKGNVTISKCTSMMNVSALARGCSGVGGFIGEYDDNIDYKTVSVSLDISDSVNVGSVVCTGEDKDTTIGGFVGASKNCTTLSGCANVGTVSGPGVTAGGLLGNAGYQTGDKRPSMENCYNAGKVTGADGRAYDFYGKKYKKAGGIAEDRMTNCYSEEGSAPSSNNGSKKVIDSNRASVVNSLAISGLVADSSGNVSLNGVTIKTAGHESGIVEELAKYSDTITVPGTAKAGYSVNGLKAGQTADSKIKVEYIQTKADREKGISGDISKGYLENSNGILKLKKGQWDSVCYRGDCYHQTDRLKWSGDEQAGHDPDPAGRHEGWPEPPDGHHCRNVHRQF